MILAETFRFGWDIPILWLFVALFTAILAVFIGRIGRQLLVVFLVFSAVGVGGSLYFARLHASDHSAAVKREGVAAQTKARNANITAQMKQDLIAEGWKKEQIYRIDPVNKSFTYLVGPFQCLVTYPLVRTKYGTGDLHWLPYLPHLNPGHLFPIGPEAGRGLADSCQP